MPEGTVISQENPINPDHRCGYCGGIDEDTQYYPAVNGRLCPRCKDEHTLTCESCGEVIWDDQGNEVRQHWYCNPCFRGYFTFCNSCEEPIDNQEIIRLPNGRHICPDCFSDEYTYCTSCDRILRNDDAIYMNDGNDGPYCSNCQPIYSFTPSATYDKNRFTRKVGFEIEFASRRTPAINTLGKLHHDGSLGNFAEFRRPHEFSSFIFNGDRLLEVIDLVADELHRCDPEVNNTCGFHVHLDVMEMNDVQKRNIREWWRIFEDTFMAMTAESRRRNQYCRRVKNASEYNWRHDRYSTLNIAAFEKYGTYEFRLHQGTLDKDKIRNWIMLLLSFVETFRLIDTCEPESEVVLKQFVKVSRMNDREKMIFFFTQLEIPLTMRKYVMGRIKHFIKEGCTKELNLKKPDFSKKTVKSILRDAVVAIGEEMEDDLSGISRVEWMTEYDRQTTERS